MRSYPTILRIVILLAFLLTLTGNLSAQRTFNPSQPSNPYGLTDFDGFNLGDYESSRWGVWQDMSSSSVSFLNFDSLTYGKTQTELEAELFLTDSLQSLNVVPFNSSTILSRTWYRPAGGGAGNVNITKQGSLTVPTLHLFRKFHFQNYLDGDWGQPAISANAKKLIVLIHGWNGGAGAWSFGDNFATLTDRIQNNIQNSDWTLSLYHWEKDAATGGFIPVNVLPPPFFVGPGLANPTEAATIGHQHGQHLGALIAGYKSCQKVHLIAHSAGAWVARAAAKYLLQKTGIAVQITLLDPFVPGEMWGNNTPLTQARIDEIPSFEATRFKNLYYLENAYAQDWSGGAGAWAPANSDSVYGATSCFFGWDSLHSWNQRVDWSPGGTPDYWQAQYYDDHAGPILFYADTILQTTQPNFSELQNPNFDLSKIGWRRSMFFNEPIFREQPKSLTKIAGETVTFSVSSEVRGLPNQSPSGLTLQWQKKMGSTWTNLGISGATLTFPNVTTAMSDTLYRAVATFGKQVEYSDEVKLSVKPSAGSVAPGVPAAPSNLKVVFASASQINLTWDVNSSNETNILLCRGTNANGPWIEIVKPARTNAYSDTGLIPATRYYYLVIARNAFGSTAAASVNASTLANITGINYTLEVKAYSSTTGQDLSAGIYSWQGVASSYKQQTTSFTRLVPKGTPVSVQVSPNSFPGGFFQYWQGSWGEKVYGDFVTINLAQSETITAVYNTGTSTPPPARTLSSISIEGPSSVNERDSATYKAKAAFSDGSTAYVTPAWEEDSTAAHFSTAGVLDAGAVTEDKTVDLKATYSSGGVQKIGRKVVTIRNTDAKPTYRLTLNASHGEIWASPEMGEYPAGTKVRLQPHADDGYVFTGWGDHASGKDNPIYVDMDGNRSISASFALDTSSGDVRVTCLPAQAAAEGAGFKVSGQGMSLNNWQASGHTVPNWKPGPVTISFKDIPGWVTPDQIKKTIIGGQTVVVNVSYREILGTVHVVIEPQDVITAGARWRLDGGPWQSGGASISDVSPGNHQVTFQAVAGWETPASRNLVVERVPIAAISAAYNPALGQPVIASISPNTGSPAGGAEVIIDGANFTPDARVTFDGKPVSAVIRDSNSRLRVTTPASAIYGSVAVSVVCGAQSSTVPNGYTYSIDLGSNMRLLGQIGGYVRAVAVSGSTAYYGEAGGLVALNISTPSSPVIVGRLPLPGAIYGVYIAGSYAYVADSTCGLQIVDISSPAAMRLVGYVDTPSSARGVEVQDQYAFVADAYAGLQMIDISNPARPFIAGVHSGIAFASRVASFKVGTKRIVVVGCDNTGSSAAGAAILDASEPANIRLLSKLRPGEFINDVKISGQTLYVAASGIVYRYNLANPDVPVLDGSQFDSPHRLSVSGSTVTYLSGMLTVVNWSNPGQPQATRYVYPDDNEDLALSGSSLLIASGPLGLRIVRMSPTPPLQIATLGVQVLPNDIKLSGSKAYVSAGQIKVGSGYLGLTEIDVSNPSKPTVLRTQTTTGRGEQVALNGGHAYLAGGNSSSSVISLPGSGPLQVVGTLPSDIRAYSIATLGGNVLVGGQTPQSVAKIGLANGSQPTNPVWLSTIQLGTGTGQIAAVATHGSIGFAALYGKGVYAVDFSSPTSPLIRGFLSLPTPISRLSVSSDGKTLYICGSQLVIADFTNLAAPAVTGSYSAPIGSASANIFVPMDGGRGVLGNSWGIHFLDVNNPTNPVRLAAYDTVSGADSLAVQGNRVYVSGSGSDALEIIEILDTSAPLVTITSPSTGSQFSTGAGLAALEGVASAAKEIVHVRWANSRGGGGDATGTNTWSVGGVQLASGTNVITIFAEDADGKIGTDVLEVVATFLDTNSPAVAITGPVPDSEFATDAETIAISGSVSDDRRVMAVNWADNHGNAGVATLNAQNWNIEAVALQAGPNVITVTAADAAGNSATDVATILRTSADAAAPSIDISFPTTAAEFATAQPTLNVSGEASDDVGVKQIRWSNNRGGSGVATGTSLWAVNGIALQPGFNSVTLTVEDEAGKTSEDNLAVTYTPPDADGDGIADAWEMQFFGNLNAASPSTDTGSVGVSDFLKFAFGMDPTRPDLLALPQYTTEEEGPNTYLTLHYRQLMVPGDIEYNIGVSNDLKDWDYSESAIEQRGFPIQTGDGLTEEVTVRLKNSLNVGESRQFFRLKVVKP